MARRIVVLISGTGSGMTAIADACSGDRLDAVVAGVLADRSCAGLELAAGRGLRTRIVDPADYPSRSEWNRALAGEVGALEPDLVLLAGFMRVLGPVFVDAFPRRLINIHPSLLPAFPGAHAVKEALEAGVKVTGTTVHLVDHEVDHGPILLQEPVRTQPGDTETTLHARIKEVEHVVLVEACRMMLSGDLDAGGAGAAGSRLHQDA